MIYFVAKDEKVFIFNASLLANQGRSFKLDIVLVYDEQMFKTIVNLSNKDFFQNKFLLRRENPGVLEIFSVQILPGKVYSPKTIQINSKKKLIGCVIFVDFSMIKGQINRKLVIGNDYEEFPIYFDENGINMIEK